MDNLPDKGKKAILALIDTKTEHEMEKVLSKLDAFEHRFENRLNAMEQKFDAKFESFQFKLNTILWAFGVLLAVMTIFKFIGD